jgi:hypothetical protein
MNLSKHQQQAFTRLNDALKAMISITQDREVIAEKLKPWLQDFALATAGEIKVKLGGKDELTFTLIDLSKDSLKSTLDASQTLYLRARVENVLLSVTAAYRDAYAHSNEAIADSLQVLADKVRALPFEIVVEGACDIDKRLGISHANADAGDDEDGSGDGALKGDLADGTPVVSGTAAPALAGAVLIDAAAFAVTTPLANAEPVLETPVEAEEPAPNDAGTISLIQVPAGAVEE